MAEPAVNTPPSGAYGEKAEAEKLRSSLPQSGAPAPAEPVPFQPTSPGRLPGSPGRPANAPPGISPEILAPAPALDGVAPAGPALGGPVPERIPFTGDRIVILDLLANSPHVSRRTREWAKLVLGIVLGEGQ